MTTETPLSIIKDDDFHKGEKWIDLNLAEKIDSFIKTDECKGTLKNIVKKINECVKPEDAVDKGWAVLEILIKEGILDINKENIAKEGLRKALVIYVENLFHGKSVKRKKIYENGSIKLEKGKYFDSKFEENKDKETIEFINKLLIDFLDKAYLEIDKNNQKIKEITLNNKIKNI